MILDGCIVWNEHNTVFGLNSITLAPTIPEIWLIPPKFKWFTWPDLAPFRDNLSSIG